MAVRHDQRTIGLVFVGGMVGTALRAGLEAAFGGGLWPWATFLINVIGAFGLGALLEILALRGPDEGIRRDLRLSVGTGLIGSFTTYSTLAVESITGRPPLVGMAYAVVSVLCGVLAAAGGIRLVRRGR